MKSIKRSSRNVILSSAAAFSFLLIGSNAVLAESISPETDIVIKCSQGACQVSVKICDSEGENCKSIPLYSFKEPNPEV